MANLVNPDSPLSLMQRKFVHEYVRMGGSNATTAAINAGYAAGNKGSSAAVSASRLLRNPEVLAEIRRETERTLKAGVALGANVLIDLAKTSNSESVKLQAAVALLDRGGMQLKALSEHTVTIEDKRSNAEMLERIKQLSRELGIGAKTIEGELVTPNKSATAVAPAIEFETIELGGGE